MKAVYKLKCIRRDKTYEGDVVTYHITPIQRGLNAIQQHIDQNQIKVKYNIVEASGEEAIFELRGGSVQINYCIHTLLCNTNIADYFKVEEWF